MLALTPKEAGLIKTLNILGLGTSRHLACSKHVYRHLTAGRSNRIARGLTRQLVCQRLVKYDLVEAVLFQAYRDLPRKTLYQLTPQGRTAALGLG